MKRFPTTDKVYNLRSKKQPPLELESTDKPKKKRPRLLHKCSYVADGFSKLPDDIITDQILPRLNFKEKVQSSVLSRRWKYLWRCSLGTELFFHHGVNALSRAEWGVGPIQRYVRAVDSILKSFSGPKLDHLSISAGMGQVFNDVLHRWIRLAIRKGLQRLNLILGPRCSELSATFPSLKRSLHSSGGICHLKELSLKYVRIRSDTLESLLSYCPFLELLSLQACLCSHLKISGPSLNLKHLEILDCKWSLKIEVSAPNLITLKYDDSNKDFILSNTPLLENLCMSHFYYDRFLEEAARHPLRHFCYLYHLKTLEFDMRYYKLEKMKGAAEFTHSCLEVLEVTKYCGSLEVCEMIEGVLSIAATSLEKLIIKYDEKETMWKRVHLGKRQEMKKVVLRRIESRLPANCRLMLN